MVDVLKIIAGDGLNTLRGGTVMVKGGRGWSYQERGPKRRFVDVEKEDVREDSLHQPVCVSSYLKLM